jgi:D-alanine-D-alanine ligase
MRIAVISTGDRSAVLRRTISRREWEGYAENAADIAASLTALGHDVVRVTDGRGLNDALDETHPQLAWVCSGGIQGRDPATHLPGLLEMLGLDYVGSPPLAAGLADNKARAKALVRDAGVPTPDFALVRAGISPAACGTPAYPVVVKPVLGMCSCGVRRADTPDGLERAVALLQQRYRDEVLIERYVEGIDVTMPVLEVGNTVRCLPALQRFFAGRNDPAYPHFDLPHPRSELREGAAMPAALEGVQLDALRAMARTAFTVLGLRHCARFDFRVAASGVWFLEANHKPDLTRASLFARSAALAGLTHPELIGLILSAARRAGAVRRQPGARVARRRTRLRLQ